MVSVLVAFFLATTSSLHPYAVDRRAAQWGVAAPAAPSETPTTAPPPPPKPAPMQEDVATDRGDPMHAVTRPKTHHGIGLTIGAGLAGATAWGLTIGKIVLTKRCNESIQEGGTQMDAEVTLYKCFTNVKAILGLSVAGWFANWATWGLAAGAGGVRGKDDGVRYAWEGRPNYAAGGLIGGGAAMFGVGLVGIGLARGLALTKMLQCDVNANINNCLTRGFRGYFAGVQISSSLVAVGLGMMVYGLVYRKNRRQFADRKVTELRIVPDVSVYRTSGSNYNGLALTGRF